ncbi:hypothetical protein ACES2I_11345 [Bdellovibrio bacteriovorus]|uniref:hypothetical protein n=1 Tax=Bdellovibrio bacteriovorus TaxID=959 RepID=UPI0035A5EFF2
MGKRSYFYTFIMMAWIFLGIFLSEKIFGDDKFAEVVLVICLASVALVLSFVMEYAIRGIGIKKDK